MLVEVCAGSVKDCMIAQMSGVHRIELNSSLHLGGLTPSLATLILAKKHVDIPIICMVRPRGAGFCYNRFDQDVMFEDAKLLLKKGADGLAFGFLTPQKTIDVSLTQKMIHLIHSYGKQAVFHRAIDCTINMHDSVETLIQLGCDRILTSGGQPTAVEGKEMLKTLFEAYHSKIELIMGSGVNANNIVALAHYTKLNQCHSSFKRWVADNTTSNGNVSYRYSDLDAYDGVDAEKLEQLMNAIGE